MKKFRAAIRHEVRALTETIGIVLQRPIASGKVYLRSRNNKDFNGSHPAIVKILANVPHETVIVKTDGDLFQRMKLICTAILQLTARLISLCSRLESSEKMDRCYLECVISTLFGEIASPARDTETQSAIASQIKKQLIVLLPG